MGKIIDKVEFERAHEELARRQKELEANLPPEKKITVLEELTELVYEIYRKGHVERRSEKSRKST